MKHLRRVLGAVLLVCGLAAAQEAVVVDSQGQWRMFGVLKPPLISRSGVLSPVSTGIVWLDTPSSPPPADWQAPSFDDSFWQTGPVTASPYAPMLANLCIRGRFFVDDSAKAGQLFLQARYHGGVIAYLNGTEVGRSDIRVEGSVPLGADYPKEVFVDAAGIPVSPAGLYVDGRPFSPSADNKRRLEMWVRFCSIPLPSELVRKGENVVALEVVRSPYDSVLVEAPVKKAFACGDFFVPSCRVVGLRVVSQGGTGVSAAPSRSPGVVVWNANVFDEEPASVPSSTEPLRPVRIVAASNGLFSGKVHVGSTEPIRGLKAQASDLRGPSGTIPASAVTIRYGFRQGGDRVAAGMSEKPLPEYPVVRGSVVVPVWISVQIPKGVEAGEYRGEVKVEASGKVVDVPVEVKVVGWEVPDSDRYRTWVEVVQSPDTLSVEYGVPLWSQRHWQMIERSFSLMRPTGSRVVYIPAISHTNLGNEQSMIRWVKQAGGGYGWDFSVMDRYLDVAERALGKPKMVVLQVWDIYMTTGTQKRFEGFISLGKPQATEYDPVTGEVRNVELPALGEPGSVEMWGRMIGEVRQRLKRRGLEGALALGMFCDRMPSKEDVAFFARVAPGVGWVQQGHGYVTKIHGIADVVYNASVWGGLGFADGCRQTNQRSAPFTVSAYGWARPTLNVVYERNVRLDSYPPSRWYYFPMTGITGEFRGIGRIGADLWKAVKGRDGRRSGYVTERYPEGHWGGTSISLTIGNPVLCPGVEGPEATVRLLALVEGVQMCEARIVVEEAVKEGWVTGEMKARCEEWLQAHLFDMWRALSNLQIWKMWGNATGWRWVPGVAGTHWFLGSHWQAKAERLFSLAAEVAVKQGGGR